MLSKLGIMVALVTMFNYTINAEDDDLSPEEIAIMAHQSANHEYVEEHKEDKAVPKKLPIKVVKGKYTYYNNIYGRYMSIDTIDIVVLADDLKIEKVTANRGRCQLISTRKKQYPKTYHYGDKISNSFIVNSNGRGTKCNVLSVEITAYNGNEYNIEF